MWILQVLLALVFLAHGLMFLAPPPDIAVLMHAMLQSLFEMLLVKLATIERSVAKRGRRCTWITCKTSRARRLAGAYSAKASEFGGGVHATPARRRDGQTPHVLVTV